MRIENGPKFNPEEQVSVPFGGELAEEKNSVRQTSSLVGGKNREQQESVLQGEGPEKWAKELSPETFGTEEERRNNFEKLLIELIKKKIKYGIPAEEFEKRLKEAREYTENISLFHSTSLKRAVGIFNLGKIASRQTLEKTKGSWHMFFQSNTLAVDKRAGLDKMVFTSPLPINYYGDVVLELDGKILDRSDCVVTYEDIIITLERFCPSPSGKLSGMFSYVKEYFGMPKVLREYRSQVISGNNFREFLSHYIAIYGVSEDYQKHQDGKLRSEIINSSNAKVHKASSSKIKKWVTTPEVKVRNEISAENIKRVVVRYQAQKDLLINNGVPEDLIKIVNPNAR